MTRIYFGYLLITPDDHGCKSLRQIYYCLIIVSLVKKASRASSLETLKTSVPTIDGYSNMNKIYA